MGVFACVREGISTTDSLIALLYGVLSVRFHRATKVPFDGEAGI